MQCGMRHVQPSPPCAIQPSGQNTAALTALPSAVCSLMAAAPHACPIGQLKAVCTRTQLAATKRTTSYLILYCLPPLVFFFFLMSYKSKTTQDLSY